MHPPRAAPMASKAQTSIRLIDKSGPARVQKLNPAWGQAGFNTPDDVVADNKATICLS
jgi:hypothetical protein